MNVYKFLNSRDVKKYLEEINYEFTPEQVLYVICKSRTTTVKEQHAALKILAGTYSDFVIEKRMSDIKSQPLKEFVKSYIAAQQRYIDDFFKKEDGCFYTARFLFDDGFGTWSDAYSDYEKAFDEYYDEILPKKNPAFITQIKKNYIDGGKEIVLDFFQDKTVSCVSVYGNEEDYGILIYPEWMWVDIPVPFKRGDIVYNVNYGRNEKTGAIDREKLMVINHIQTWDVKDWKENGYIDGGDTINSVSFKHVAERRKSHIKFGDESDMCVVGNLISDTGRIGYDHIWPYLDFEYFRGELNGEFKTLKLLSSFKKGKIDDEFALNAYYILRSELAAEKKFMCDLYIKEALEAAGLIEPEKGEKK